MRTRPSTAVTHSPARTVRWMQLTFGGLAAALGVLMASGWVTPARAAERAPIDVAARLQQLAQDPKSTAVAVERGQKLSTFCANCHGPSGNSVQPEVPNLAGQNAAYLFNQMHLFDTGQRKDSFMSGLIKAMNEEERIDVVLYFSGQAVHPREQAARQLVEQGAQIYEKVCFRCHGTNGLGDATIPRVAGQPQGFLFKALKRYRDGSDQRSNPLMAANTKLLSDADLQAAAAYISALK